MTVYYQIIKGVTRKLKMFRTIGLHNHLSIQPEKFYGKDQPITFSQKRFHSKNFY